MARFGTAPALSPAPTLIGPLLSAAGFRYWYMVCEADCLTIVPQGFGDGFFASHAGFLFPRRMNFYAYNLFTFLKKTGQKRRQKMETALSAIPASNLRIAPNRVYEASRLRGITLVGHRWSAINTPDLILEMIDGTKDKYGIQRHDFDQASAVLTRMYPGLCKVE